MINKEKPKNAQSDNEHSSKSLFYLKDIILKNWIPTVFSGLILLAIGLYGAKGGGNVDSGAGEESTVTTNTEQPQKTDNKETTEDKKIDDQHIKRITRYIDGTIKSKEILKNGKREGLSVLYHDNGEKKSEVRYKNGKKDGLFAWWNEFKEPTVAGEYENGRILWEERYRNNKQIVHFTEWWHGTNIKKIISKERNGKRDGIFIEYFENGNKRYVESYRNGEKDGKFTEYFENKDKRTVERYKNGKLDGLFKLWTRMVGKDSKTFLYKTGRYKNGKEDGKVEYMDENGNRTSVEKWENGELIKTW